LLLRAIDLLSLEALSNEVHDVRLAKQGENRVAKRDNGPVATGPLLLVERRKEEGDMLRINMRFNFAVHLPLRWIAALFYLFR
jgi:hypothetical protein